MPPDHQHSPYELIQPVIFFCSCSRPSFCVVVVFVVLFNKVSVLHISLTLNFHQLVSLDRCDL